MDFFIFYILDTHRSTSETSIPSVKFSAPRSLTIYTFKHFNSFFNVCLMCSFSSRRSRKFTGTAIPKKCIAFPQNEFYLKDFTETYLQIYHQIVSREVYSVYTEACTAIRLIAFKRLETIVHNRVAAFSSNDSRSIRPSNTTDIPHAQFKHFFIL